MVASAAFSPDSKSIVTGAARGAWLWQGGTGTPQLTLPHPDVAYSVAFSPDGRAILTGGYDANIRLWDPATGQLLGPPLRMANPVWVVAYGPDGKSFLATGGAGGTVFSWEASPEGNDRVFSTPHVIGVVRFSPDGKTLLTGGMKLPLTLPRTRDDKSAPP